ncbi:MAG: TonB-dependent receptor [Acidobacteria bacterium]|nr:TonB-dependent receptor [Acidobacteriota bacterium]MCI0721940.1 TonB-dependent receptor [Acidobacteriota bacterium]
MKIMRQSFPYLALCLLILLGMGSSVLANTSATITGRVTDQQELVVPGAQVLATNILTNVNYSGETNDDGFYRIPNLPPGEYRVIVQKEGFASVAKPGVELHVQDIITLNFAMQIGSVTQTVTVEGGAPLINTESGTISTVVDRQFVGNLPLNGRSFQTLIQLTPGVVLTAASFNNPGQFSVNGQRASANYFTVDGVGANIGVSPVGGLSQTAGGAAPGLSAAGGTNNLVSVDALEEFRVQTSTYAPEFGRTPGAQISILTRSGTNEFHGRLFEYFRNEVLDANDWFANQNGLPKAKLRQNNFGGVLGGPIIKNRTFFFFSYEGQRLSLPETGISTVPSQSARQSASAAIRPFLDAYPQPNGIDFGNGQAEFNATFSNPSNLSATSVRVDHRLNSKLNFFGRYNYAPSDVVRRGVGGGASLNTFAISKISTQTATIGSTWSISSNLSNDFRFNYSRNAGSNRLLMDDFGGASVPPDSILFPSPFSSRNSQISFLIIQLQRRTWTIGRNAENLQRQLNIVNGLSTQKGKHGLKFGIDYRRLNPEFGPPDYTLQPIFLNVAAVVAGTPRSLTVTAGRKSAVAFHQVGAYAQDAWGVNSRMTLTYGLRWEFEPPPSTTRGPDLFAVTGINPATLALAPAGTPLWKTRYWNFAPRVGLAYQLSDKRNFETVVRGGFGVFYDLATQQVGSALFIGFLPFSASRTSFSGLTFPLTPALTQPPSFSPLPSPLPALVANDPRLELPYTLQWNTSVEQGVGNSQAVSLSYVAAVGRRLTNTEILLRPNPNFIATQLVSNGSTSDYHALQVQFQRRMARGLQALASYGWSHSIDTGSSSAGDTGNLVFRGGSNANINRGSSDFDIRHTFAAAVTYDIPIPRWDAFARALLGGWSLDSIIQGRSAPPVVVFDPRFLFPGTFAVVRPDVIPGVPLYLEDPSFAGHKRINPAAFQNPPLDPVTGAVTRQGTLPRSALRGFGVAQWDFSLRRHFDLTERWRLQFRAEFFNLLNHPNFGNPEGSLASPLFGRSTQMLGRSLGGGTSPGVGFTPLYQIGGPRSVQFALKLDF